MNTPLPKIVAGLFYAPQGFDAAMAELRWTVRQNPEFWKTALLYVDAACERQARPYAKYFGEVVVDRDLPAIVREHPMWNCKGWWAHRAVQRFGAILYCDFDVLVVRQPDAALATWLGRAPRFLHMPNYNAPNKVVGCGCAYYDQTCDWDRYLDLLYNKWFHDERAWTEVLALTKEKQLADGFDMNPKIVNWDWLAAHPEARRDVYLVHGLSDVAREWRAFRDFGFDPKEIRFYRSWRARLNHLILKSGWKPRA